MKPVALTGLALAAILAAGSAGYWAGHRGIASAGLRSWFGIEGSLAANEPVGTGPVVYYQDPDRRPVYSAQPRQTEDGRPFTAVRASQDISFEEKPATGERTVQADPKRVLYYRNPMGLPDTSPVPKKDSMGMDYLPVYEGEGNEDGVIKLSPGRIQRSGVRSEPVRRQSIVQTIHVPGVVQLDERRVSVVTIRADAFVQEVAPITTGDRVTKGTRLARIYSPEISTAGAQFITELNAVARGVPEGGARQRLENLGVPSEVIAEIERNRKVPLTINWSAPRDGIVLERSVSDGMKMTAGGSLFRLADISTIWVLADVPERQLAAVGIGAPATVRLRGRPGSSFEGRVSVIYPEIAEATRTAKVRIEIGNRDGMLLPNMYADVEIGSGDAGPLLAVPDSAVIDSGTRRVVILDLGEGRFEPREVKLGRRGDGRVAITEGVAEGDRVVVSANFLIDAESNLKAALSGFAQPEAKP
ncbi:MULTISPECIES: efflux RND transporter periplasmic adaptor subunit [Bosea]|uniref:Efflux RND transporter periplasmic adaptor subunit n=3 Tax=Bosea TaxID=85413 RepID=A0A927I1F4_9HYPH|nr:MULTISPECIES: efflux RND transporter periplasmic adaptor subunit [Bosea]MBD3847317.1 efflux RND transporter periplasmic adaptor subunit [Bosea spartocytisi]MCP4559306.1 efflux RND transporter periplasmic adaptor subunit [Bosea sp. (in: a-proteobacteria)]MCP4733907.1 efflux RND transporter periplasmic adaptor subunit [Bosea sp. (in: a-proteobacteria)]MCT4475387.1 efflux RND transporter periplasmic adaptor subunit [Bosea spartocytisi]